MVIKLTKKTTVVNYTAIRNSMTVVLNAFYKGGLLPFAIVKDLREKVKRDQMLMTAVKELAEILTRISIGEKLNVQ